MNPLTEALNFLLALAVIFGPIALAGWIIARRARAGDPGHGAQPPARRHQDDQGR